MASNNCSCDPDTMDTMYEVSMDVLLKIIHYCIVYRV